MNLGTGVETRMGVLAEKIRLLVGYEGEIVWNEAQPNGQWRRVLETSRARALGSEARTTLDEGLRKTLGWWMERRIVLRKGVSSSYPPSCG